MKTADGFVKKTIAGIPYLLPYGQKIACHARSLRLNDSGALLWNALSSGAQRSTLLSILMKYYDADADMLPQFESDLDNYLASLKQFGMLIDNANAGCSLPCPTSDGTTFPALSSDSRAPKYYKIGSLCFAWFGPNGLFDTYFKDFSCEASAPDQRIFMLIGEPSDLSDGTLLLCTAELSIFDVTDTYRFVFGIHWGIHEMRVKKDGSAAVLYCTDDYIKKHSEDVFHALRFAFLIAAQNQNLFVLHSVSILYQGKAWLFSGSSGTGKSTHTRLWADQYKTPILNGDLNVLGIHDGVPYVYGLPWCGTSETYTVKTYPLGGIVFLKQAPFNRADLLPSDEQALFLMQRMISPTWTKDLMLKNLAFAETLAPQTKIFRLSCTKDPDAATVIKNAIDQSL